jgi:tetratricopeptide (TPR) repeat protein
MYHEGKEDYDRALADFIKAIQLEPGCYPYYTWRGRAYWKKKDYDLAIADFTESINLNSSYDTYKERGDVYHDKGDYELAIADYDRAIAAIDESIAAGDRLFEEHPEWYTSAPDHTEINKERDFVAYVKEKTEKALAYSRVIEEHTGVIRLNPGDASAYVGRGDVYRDERDYELAIADYTEAIRLRPGEVSYYKHRAEVYAEARNYSRASEEYTRLVKLDPKNADYHNYYAEAYAEVARERGSREGITLDDLILEMDIHDSAPSYE